MGPNGRTLYLFTADKGKKSVCYGQCAAYWPPLADWMHIKPLFREKDRKLDALGRQVRPLVVTTISPD